MSDPQRTGGPHPGLADDLRPLFSPRILLAAWLPCLAITVCHYATGPEYPWVHDVLRRLYYLPILFAAFIAGSRGAIALSVFASLVYLPHAFGSLVARDPGGALEKGLEIFLYNAIALVAGLLVDRERRERDKAQRLAAELSQALEEQRRVEQQLIRAGKLGALGEMTAGIAHEIKNPLHAMKGTAEILRDVVPEETPERRMLDLHMAEIDRLSQVAERFLLFARPMTPDRRPTDLREVVSRVVALVEPQARRHGVTVSQSPCLADPAPIVSGDPDQLVQLLLNVALNGIQAMAPAGSGTLSMAIGRLRHGEADHVFVRVANSGPPIPEDALERIFDPFYTTRDEGTGLGLSICSRIADQHDGGLSVVNLPAGGVAFTLQIPALPVDDGD
jgi:two-component system, NtrC family, sensor histidine kinase HydH